MAGAGFKTFGVGDVLTASDVNTYLMQQAVMNFADSGARGSAIGTATEGMVSYLQDTDAVEVYDGSAWVGLGGGFTASTAITATDASWSVPTLADPVVRVIVVGAGGGGGGGSNAGGAGFVTGGAGGAGGSSTFASSAGTATAAGGAGGQGGGTNASGIAGTAAFAAGNAGQGGTLANNSNATSRSGEDGRGGAITVGYFDLTGVSTASVTVGAGGAAGAGEGSGAKDGGAGGAGVVVFEYRAG